MKGRDASGRVARRIPRRPPLRSPSPAPPASPAASATHGGTGRYFWLLGAVLATFLLVTSGGFSPVAEAFTELASTFAGLWKSVMERAEVQVKSTGAMAPAYFVLLYTVSSIFCLPLFGFHTIAGYMYGTLPCAVMVSTCQTIGAAAAFVFARHFVRPSVEEYLRRRWGRRFVALDRALVKEVREGIKIVFLIRASPVLPFSVTNYLCGCTQLGLGPFLLATWAGVLPGTTSYCSVGAAGKVAADGGQTLAQKILLGCGVAAALVMVKVISDIASKSLAQAGLGDQDSAALAKPVACKSSTPVVPKKSS